MNIQIVILFVLFIANIVGSSFGIHSTIQEATKSWIFQVVTFYIGYFSCKINGHHIDHDKDTIFL